MSATRPTGAILAATLSVLSGSAAMSPGVCIASDYSDAVLADNPLAYYRLNETAGPTAANVGTGGGALDATYMNLFEDVGPGNLGQPGPQTPTFPGLEADNRAAHFAPLSPPDYPRVERLWSGDADPLAIGGALTLEAWIYRDPQTVLSGNDNEGIISRYQGFDPETGLSAARRAYNLYFDEDTDGGGSISMALSSSGSFQSGNVLDATIEGGIPENEWLHVAATYEPSARMAIFINGSLAAEKTDDVPASLYTGQADLWIGQQFTDAEVWTFEGLVDEAAIYDYALSDAQLLSHYQAAVGAVLTPMPDLNMDAAVDIFDVAIVSNNWGAIGTPGDVPGDANKDGEVDIFDIALISNNWNPGGAAVVPEPACISLALSGVLVICLWGRRISDWRRG